MDGRKGTEGSATEEASTLGAILCLLDHCCCGTEFACAGRRSSAGRMYHAAKFLGRRAMDGTGAGASARARTASEQRKWMFVL